MKKVMFVITLAFMTMTAKVSAQSAQTQTQPTTMWGYIVSDIQAMKNGNSQFYAYPSKNGGRSNMDRVTCHITTGIYAGQDAACAMDAGMVAGGTYQKGDVVAISPTFVIISGNGTNCNCTGEKKSGFWNL